MILPTTDGNFFQTQYYGSHENANFLSHHMALGILLLTPFPILFGSELGFGIGIFFSLRLQFHFYITI
ncbi:membrane protein, PF09852 family [Leptospira interrogans serovar Australis str. 200703203]|uniref:Membrane protein, PF09852 family n=1 Tax=Leptospira interrogans serovar Australis str. 200703203 TaxID=1085541 RepID=N1UVS9_LEPIR|nr:membrane protein, PF09852 family [Leptospira interrogans serovar Australis str. 200703203]